MVEAVFLNALLDSLDQVPELRAVLRAHRQNVGTAYVHASEPGRRLLQALLRRDWRGALAVLKQAAGDPRAMLIRIIDMGPPLGAGDIAGIVLPSSPLADDGGYHVEWEVKGTTTKYQPHQRSRAEFINGAGGIHVLSRAESEDITRERDRAVDQVLFAIAQRRARRGRAT